MSPQDWIRHLKLKPHPEGGRFKETWRAGMTSEVMHEGASKAVVRSAMTVIYYILQRGEVSRLHRINSDEVWCLHAGNLDVHAFDDAGRMRTYKLGTHNERLPQAIVPAGWWFGAELPKDEAYALVSCIVAPGFDFDDLTMADAGMIAALMEKCPRGAALIERLTAE